MKHILFILTDQQRKDTIGAYGNPTVQTPNLDALASDSTVYEHCYTSSPVCVPARFSLFTGQYCNRHGNNNNNKDNAYQGEGFYAELTKAGFDTCCIGKMHHTVDPYGLMGFNKRITQEELAHPDDDYTQFIRENYPHVYDYHGMRSEMYYVPQISQLPAEDHPTGWIGNKAVEHILSCDPEKPMMLMASFIHPHPPFAPPAPWHKLYREDPLPPLEPEEADMATFKGMMTGKGNRERLQISDQDMRRQKNFYHACVSFVDYQIGRIIGALKQKGMYEDTMIVFTSDHGDMMGDYGYIGKRNMVDGASNIPLIVRYPGKAPSRSEKPCSIVDIPPTILEFAGVDYEKAAFDGLDLNSDTEHPYVFSQYDCGPKGVYMVTDGKRKLVYQTASDSYYYFDSLPEQRAVPLEGADAMALKAALDAHRDADVNKTPGATSSLKKHKTHPHTPNRVDQAWTIPQETAEIPAGYKIDIGWD